SFSERGWFLMRKNRSKARSHISNSKRSRVLPAATTPSIHSRNCPRRNSDVGSRSARGGASPSRSDLGGWVITAAPVSPAVARLRGPCYNRDRLGDLQRGARLDPLALQTRFAVGVGALVASLAALAALAVALGVPPLAVAGAELVLGLLSAIPLARSLARA